MTTQKNIQCCPVAFLSRTGRACSRIDCLTRSEHQLVIPVAMQQRILEAAHEGHPGNCAF